MIVYILIEDNCEGQGIQGVFNSYEKALKEKERLENIWGYYYIEEKEVQ